MNKLWVLGMGPGSLDYVLPVTKRKVQECEILVGGKRQLELFRRMDKKEIILQGDLRGAIEKIKGDYQRHQVGVLVSGDPGFYSFLNTLLSSFPREDLEVYPGISSLQYLFAKGVIPWQDAYLASLHGRNIEDLVEIVMQNQKVALLTEPAKSPSPIAQRLMESGVTKKRVLVGENLSYPDERIRDLPLEEWPGQETANLCVMVIYDE